MKKASSPAQNKTCDLSALEPPDEASVPPFVPMPQFENHWLNGLFMEQKHTVKLNLWGF